MEYIAIKIRDFNHWVWFEKKHVQEDSSTFIGKQGWGKDGALTEVSIPKRMIEGRIESKEPQYR